MPKESNRRLELIPATRPSGKTNVSRLLNRQSFLTALCIALYLLTASQATVPDPKEPYKIGQATDESKKMREPPQPVQQRSTKQFPPMTSSDADFPAVMTFPEAVLP